MTTLTLQPDGAAGLDAYIDSAAPTANQGWPAHFYVGEYPTVSQILRSLIKFDLSSIPVSARCISATLSLYALWEGSTSNRYLRVFRDLRAWVEGEVTWNVYATGLTWTGAGGSGAADREQTDIGSVYLGATDPINEFKNIVLTPAKVQEMWSGILTNNGFLLQMDTEADDAWQFASSDHTTATYRPKLVIEYDVPGGSQVITAA